MGKSVPVPLPWEYGDARGFSNQSSIAMQQSGVLAAYDAFKANEVIYVKKGVGYSTLVDFVQLKSQNVAYSTNSYSLTGTTGIVLIKLDSFTSKKWKTSFAILHLLHLHPSGQPLLEPYSGQSGHKIPLAKCDGRCRRAAKSLDLWTVPILPAMFMKKAPG